MNQLRTHPERGTDPSSAREAEALLAEALAQKAVLHHPNKRELHRALLGRAIERADAALREAVQNRAEPRVQQGLRRTLVLAHAARAEDARHGAGQLSRGAQRAPTPEDCEDGWHRVASIVATSEASASECARHAQTIADPAIKRAAEAAGVAARAARRILADRNHAYTFHTDPKFSFGEGWYLAAAGVLRHVAIQVEPGQPQSIRAERFLRDAGLSRQLVPYRPRPRANKALPRIVARAFCAETAQAQAKLRAAFLGGVGVPREIQAFADEHLMQRRGDRKVLLWVRQGVHHPSRNTNQAELGALVRCALAQAVVPVLIGDALAGREYPTGALDMTLFWKCPLFQGLDMRRAQLQLFEYMRQAHGVVGQVGVTTAGMDGPALMGLPTMYLTQEPNVRLGSWVGAVPGYEEVVRQLGYLEHISQTLRAWSRRS